MILGGIPTAEANKFMFIFTRDFGLIGAHVQGVRGVKSKLRYGLQDFSHSNLSLVHGKSGWKIVGSHPKTSWFTSCKHSTSKLYVCAQIVSFLRKLVRGEEKDEELFDMIFEGFDFLSQNNFSYKETGTFQCLIMLRILKHLGYVGDMDWFDAFPKKQDWSISVLEIVAQNQAQTLSVINKALKESHL